MMYYNFDPNGPTTLTDAALINPSVSPGGRPRLGIQRGDGATGPGLFSVNRDSVLNALKAQQSNIWHYQFNWSHEAPPWNDVYGAAHFIDMHFVFGNFGRSELSHAVVTDSNEGGRMALSQAMMASIGAFARTGDPNNASLGVTWPVWPKTLIFDASLTDKSISVQ